MAIYGPRALTNILNLEDLGRTNGSQGSAYHQNHPNRLESSAPMRPKTERHRPSCATVPGLFAYHTFQRIHQVSEVGSLLVHNLAATLGGFEPQTWFIWVVWVESLSSQRLAKHANMIVCRPSKSDLIAWYFLRLPALQTALEKRRNLLAWDDAAPKTLILFSDLSSRIFPETRRMYFSAFRHA